MNDEVVWSPTSITYQQLAPFGFDLTERAARGELQLGEKDEAGLERTLQILTRRRMNNITLLSKDVERCRNIVEWLAHHIVKGNAPIARKLLYQTRIFWLNTEALLEGVETSADFDARFNPLLEEVKAKNVILYIEEVEKILAHYVPHLFRNLIGGIRLGHFRVISTSTLTLAEFTKDYLSNAASDRSLAPVELDLLPSHSTENNSASE